MTFISNFTSICRSESDLTIMEEKEENPRAAKEQQIRYEKEILIKNLTFSYQNKEVLHNILGKITKGEHIALVGISGSRKNII